MVKYFLTDTNGNKKGPYDEQQLQSGIARGIITANTPLETEGGHKGLAGQIPGLNFNAAVPPQTGGQSARNGGNYFYFDQTNQRRGPVSEQQLHVLAVQGSIGPMTPLETDGGYRGVASQIKGLFPTGSTSSNYTSAATKGKEYAQRGTEAITKGAGEVIGGLSAVKNAAQAKRIRSTNGIFSNSSSVSIRVL